MDEYNGLETKIGYTFNDKSFLIRALTHSSYANELSQRENGSQRQRNGANPDAGGGHFPVPDHNEKLEFLGDSILGFIIADLLFRKRPDENEGRLSKRRAAIVCEPSLAFCARELGLPGYMKLGNNLSKEWNRRQDSVLSDAMEAIFAAVYLDGGIESSRRVITHCLGSVIDEALAPEKIIDHKSRLQEHFFAVDKGVKIEYSVIKECGPAHRRRFTSQVAVNGRILGRGDGATKKESEQNAAKEAYLNI